MKLPLSVMLIACLPMISSCSDDTEKSEEPQSVNEIRFSAAIRNVPRSGDVTTNNLHSFNVYAYLATSGSVFMDNVTVEKGSDNVWTYSPVKYWPVEALNFYAFAPAGWVPSTGPLEKIRYDNVSGMTDIVYAVSLNRTQPGAQTDAQVRFNFRHALSKVNVMLGTTNESLDVRVANVSLVGISQEAYFSFPAASTDGEATTASTGSWSEHGDPYAYPLFMAQSQSDILKLGSTPVDPNSEGYFAQYMIPQELKWTDNTDYKNSDYLQIDFSIYDPQTGAKIWPNKNTPEENLINSSTNGDGRVKFPLLTSTVTEWKPGYHYIYNVTINGHHDIGAIDFGSPTVDTFVESNTDFEFTGTN